MLQNIYNLTDRATEYGIKDNAAYKLFCGVGVMKNWRAPDHTKIEEFRNRLSAETQRNIANTLVKIAVPIWVRRSQGNRLRFDCAGGPDRLSFRRKFNVQAFRNRQKVCRLPKNAHTQSTSARLLSRYEYCQTICQVLFFRGQERRYRKTSSRVSRSPDHRQAENASGRGYLQRLGFCKNRPPGLEYSTCIRSNQ